MKLFINMFLCIAIGAIFLALAGCSKDNNTGPAIISLTPPTNLRALSKDTTVQLIWDASEFQSDKSFANYRIFTTGASSRIDSTTSTTILIPGLINGTVDTFEVFTVRNDGAISDGIRIVWGPTVRYMHRKIYECDSQNPNGLVFSAGNTLHFQTAVPDSIDLWIDGRNGATPVLKNPGLIAHSAGWRATKFAQHAGSGLDQYYPIPGVSAFTNDSLAISSTEVYFAVNAGGNYVRFISSEVQGTAPDRFVYIDISYNSIPQKPWAKR
jgi:hypothetical protein